MLLHLQHQLFDNFPFIVSYVVVAVVQLFEYNKCIENKGIKLFLFVEVVFTTQREMRFVI
eukprot:m.60278 g.60278  ORF g.60278 m.60278 type:complete len:60 (+) comp11362_c1_seq1:22-201(+)